MGSGFIRNRIRIGISCKTRSEELVYWAAWSSPSLQMLHAWSKGSSGCGTCMHVMDMYVILAIYWELMPPKNNYNITLTRTPELWYRLRTRETWENVHWKYVRVVRFNTISKTFCMEHSELLRNWWSPIFDRGILRSVLRRCSWRELEVLLLP